MEYAENPKKSRQFKKNKNMKRIIVAMSHKLQEKQVLALSELGYEIVESKAFVSEKCNALDPRLTSEDLREIAEKILDECWNKSCSAIAMTGEPMLTYHVWQEATRLDIKVLQSTTERKTVEVEQADGSMLKTQIFDHVQWRNL